MKTKKIAVIELHHETNSFSSVPTTYKEFNALALYYDEDCFEKAKEHKFQIYGFLKAVEKIGKGGIEAIPTISAWAISGGPIKREVYEELKAKALDRLQPHPDLAGIYLSMHGAMGVEGLRDPESDMLRSLRDIYGKEFPIGVSYDLHANITKERVELATFITSYRTNPHRDHFRVGFQAGKILIRTVMGEVKPVMAYRKMKLLKGGGITIDFLPPMRKIFRWMGQMEKQKKVLSVANFMVHIWLDDEEMGWSAICTTDGDQALADKLVEELCDLNWSVRGRPHPTPATIEEAIQKAKRAWLHRKTGTVIFCDTSDIVAAGGTGENIHILKAVLNQVPNLVSYVPFRDNDAVAQAFDTGVGNRIELKLGGKLHPSHKETISIVGKVLKITETEFGKTAVVKCKGMHLVLTEVPNPVYFPGFFRKLGLSPWRADIIVVKNLFPFRLYYLPYNRKTISVSTQGITDLDVHKLDYKKIPRPIYPLDQIDDWR